MPEQVDLLDKSIVNVGGVVIRGPYSLSIGRGRTSSVILLFTRVYDRDSIVHHGKCDGVLIQPRVGCNVWKTRDVVVFYKVPQKRDIFAICLNTGECLGQIGHAAVAAGHGSKRTVDLIPYRKVEEATHVILVIANTVVASYRVVVDFTDNVNLGG